MLFDFPALSRSSHQSAFDRIGWSENTASLKAWQRGLTGYPIVDAGMRAALADRLDAQPRPHDRRLVPDQAPADRLARGRGWFWDTLVDADLANNAVSWQWVAGSGADAAPYFRIFNPVLQGEKFDPDGAYVEACVPEIAKLPSRFIHAPWEAPDPQRRRASGLAKPIRAPSSTTRQRGSGRSGFPSRSPEWRLSRPLDRHPLLPSAPTARYKPRAG